MNEQAIDLPCPICSSTGNVNMIAHIDEIPYFGEHTQVTILCHDCELIQVRSDRRFACNRRV